jgi:hypothetical protein
MIAETSRLLGNGAYDWCSQLLRGPSTEMNPAHLARWAELAVYDSVGVSGDAAGTIGVFARREPELSVPPRPLSAQTAL